MAQHRTNSIKQTPDGNLPVSAETQAMLRQLEIQLQDNLTAWAKRKIWFIGWSTSIFGALGIYTFVTTSLNSAIAELMKKPADKFQQQADRLQEKGEAQLSQFQDTYSKMTSELATFASSREAAQNDMERARKSAVEIQDQFDEVSAGFSLIKDRVSGMNQEISDQAAAVFDDKSKKVKAGSSEVYSYAFETASSQQLLKLLGDLRFNYENDLLALILKSARGAELTAARPEDQVGTTALDEKVQALKVNFERSADRLIANNKLKIVIYLRDGQGFRDQAIQAANQLRKLGYRADVWNTNDTSLLGAEKELGEEFPGAKASLAKFPSGIVAAAGRESNSTEIHDVLSQLPVFFGITTIEADASPALRHLRRPPRPDYASEDVILVYLFDTSHTVSEE